jgi:hypothetical protein
MRTGARIPAAIDNLDAILPSFMYFVARMVRTGQTPTLTRHAAWPGSTGPSRATRTVTPIARYGLASNSRKVKVVSGQIGAELSGLPNLYSVAR